MKFAFFIHPLSQSTRDLYRLNNRAALLEHWGTNLLRFTAQLHRSLRETPTVLDPSRPQVYDHMPGLSSARGSSAEGRIYEIPMDAAEILADPHRAVDFMEQAVDDAAAWGAKLVGLGSLTGIVAGQGERLQHRGPLAVTTGNSLTVFRKYNNCRQICKESPPPHSDVLPRRELKLFTCARHFASLRPTATSHKASDNSAARVTHGI